jgi:Na+/H+-dicarboxylate symporter
VLLGIGCLLNCLVFLLVIYPATLKETLQILDIYKGLKEYLILSEKK